MTNDKIIDLKQIRTVTLDTKKEDATSVIEKISGFFQNVLYFKPGIQDEKNEKLLQTDVTFVQTKIILNQTDLEIVNKIPDKLRNFISSYSSFINYTFEYDTNKTLEEQFIYEDTKSLIAYFDYTYFADDAEKKLIESVWLEKDQCQENNIQSTAAFQCKDDEQIDSINNSETSLIVKKENFFLRFINKLKALFKRHNLSEEISEQ